MVLNPTSHFGHTRDHASSFRAGTSVEEQEKCSKLLQNAARKYIGSKFRLHKANLAERLLFESSVVWETARFVNQVLVFALLMVALRLSTNEIQKRGIRVNLDEAFDFEGLQALKSRAHFVEDGLPSISAASRDFFLLSSKYFNVRGAGDQLILSNMVSFSKPTAAGQLELSGPEFSFTVWVRSDANFVKGYILRKGLGKSGKTLSCWGWYLHTSFGPQLHYGAHDFFPTDPEFGASSAARQEHITLDNPEGFQSGQFFLLTMSVTAKEVTFFKNLENIGTTMLPKQVTDCNNDGRGIELGSAGLELGVLRYHPTALTRVGIEELFFAGGILNDVSTGSEPAPFDVSEIESLDGSVKTALNDVSDSVGLGSQRAQINSVLDKAVEVEHSSPPFPTGSVAVPSAETRDALTGRNYTSLVMGPARLTRTSTLATHRYLTNVPSFAGTGMSLSFWYRHRKECVDPNDACGLYLFAAYSDASERKCWALWLENSKVWYDNADGDAEVLFANQYMGGYVEDKFNLRGDRIWRHLTMVLDQDADEILWYIDGTFAVKAPWGSQVEEADCTGANRRFSLGHEDPGYTYGQEVELYDLRMYVHKDGSPALTPAEIKQIASAPTPALEDKDKCLPIDSEFMEEQEWNDVYGNDCTWYAERSEQHPRVCGMPGAAENCPISCKTRQECWSVAAKAPAFFSWSGIRRVEPVGSSPNGTLCLAAGLSRARVAEQCAAWRAGGAVVEAEMQPWLDSYRKQYGRRLDLRDCPALAAAVDAQCAFNETAVRAFTAAMQANNGDFTLAFWMKPLGEVSFNEANNRFIPALHFLATLSPPRHNLAFGLWENPNGEARVFSTCADKPGDFDNVEMKTASDSDWTFVALSRKNPRAGASAEATVLTNLDKMWEGSAMRHCPYANDAAGAEAESFFSAIEVNYPVLISPIMMVPQAVPIAALQQSFLASVKDMSVKSGPSSSASSTSSGDDDTAGAPTIEVSKDEFSQPSVLVAPPILFQTRAAPKECGSSFSQSFLKSQHDAMLKGQCAHPFVCSEELRASPSSLLACAGELLTSEAQFGLTPQEFQGAHRYVDFLYSVTESVFLFRDGELYETAEFIDQMTREVSVLLVFFTPEADTTTVLTVTADFASSSAMNVDVGIEHFEILEGSQLTVYIVMQSLVLICVAIMFADILHNLKTTLGKCIEDRRLKLEDKAVRKGSTASFPDADGRAPSIVSTTPPRKEKLTLKAVLDIVGDLAASVRELAKDLVDFSIALMVIVYIAYRIPSKQASAEETMRVVGQLGSIDWGSREITYDEKTDAFVAAMTKLDGLIKSERSLNQLCNIVLVFSLLRLIKCTSMHPRLALLEGTIKKAWDDLWHAAILILLLMTCFAGIATWRFGSDRADFADFETSLQKLFEMTFGTFPDDWVESRDLQLFTVLYFMIVFLLVQNFLLAVIVEAYMGVRKDNEDMETEQEFLTDIWSSTMSHWHAYCEGWPTPFQMGSELEQWQARYSVGFRDLVGMKLGGQKDHAFRDKEAVVRFLRHYAAYEFLAPIAFDDYGPEPSTEQDKLAHALEIRLGKAMGLKIPTLKEFAAENLRAAQERAELRARGVPDPRKQKRKKSRALLDPPQKEPAALPIASPVHIDTMPPAPSNALSEPARQEEPQRRPSAGRRPSHSYHLPALPGAGSHLGGAAAAAQDPSWISAFGADKTSAADAAEIEVSVDPGLRRPTNGGLSPAPPDPIESNGRSVSLTGAVRRVSREEPDRSQRGSEQDTALVWGGEEGGTPLTPASGSRKPDSATDDAAGQAAIPEWDRRRSSLWGGVIPVDGGVA